MDKKPGSRPQDGEAPAFPLRRPEIVITASNEPPFPVDCPELRWWSIVPRVGERASFADYYPPDWALKEVYAMHAVRPATVHGVEGVEIETRLWKPGGGWGPAGALYGRLTDDQARYLAVSLAHEGTTQVQTFLDDAFEWNWGEMDRALADRGDFVPEADGSLRRSPDAAEVAGAGVFSVGVGGRRFTCLRVLDGDVTDDSTYLTESYLTRDGRTVLVRRFCQPRFPEIAEYEVVLDPAEPLVIDGVVFLHWYDTVTSLAL